MMPGRVPGPSGCAMYPGIPSASCVSLRAVIVMSRLLSDPDHDLADLAVGLHELDGPAEVAELEDLVDDRVNLAGLEVGHDVADEAPHGLRALRRRAEPVADAEDGQAVAMQRFEIDGRAELAIHVPDRRQPSLVAERPETFGEHRPADVVHHEIHALAVGGLHDGVVEVAGAGPDADVEPVLLESAQLLRGA